MNGALVVLAVNITVASLFAAGYAIIAIYNRAQRAALWFSLTYLIGMVSPISDLLVPLVGAPELFEWLGYSAFLVSLLSISATFSLFHGRPISWAPLGWLLVGGLLLRLSIWDLPRDTISYGLAYQMPFLLASLLAVRSVWVVEGRRSLHLLLAGLYAAFAAHYLVKPVLAASLGSGSSLSDYTKTTYALVSQASTGILLLASGIVLLLLVAQKAISDSQLASETDPLSGLANRRGFDRRANEALVRAADRDVPVSLVAFDLDHFKSVNDSFGHAVGDQVIAGFAALLRDGAPGAAVIARTGGEEFTMLIEGATAHTAWLHAEAIRTFTARAGDDDRPTVTVSAGVAERRRGESLADLMRRADAASYDAKRGGRDRIVLAVADPASHGSPVVSPLRRLVA